jgi:hypothetical protein
MVIPGIAFKFKSKSRRVRSASGQPLIERTLHQDFDQILVTRTLRRRQDGRREACEFNRLLRVFEKSKRLKDSPLDLVGLLHVSTELET